MLLPSRMQTHILISTQMTRIQIFRYFELTDGSPLQHYHLPPRLRDVICHAEASDTATDHDHIGSHVFCQVRVCRPHILLVPDRSPQPGNGIFQESSVQEWNFLSVYASCAPVVLMAVGSLPTVVTVGWLGRGGRVGCSSWALGK